MLHHHATLLNPENLRQEALRRLHAAPGEPASIAGRDVPLYRIELEIQNEHLRQALLEAEAARDRYAELFDYAPIAFLTMDSAGQIDEANLTARLLLDADGVSSSLGSIFAYLISADDAERLNACFQQLRSGRLRAHCALTLRDADGSARPVTAYLTVVPDPSAARLRMALVERTPPAD